MSSRSLPLVAAVALLPYLLTACGGDSGNSTSAPANDFCSVYAEHRDGPATDAAQFADQLEAAGAPEDLGEPARSGFATFLSYLRDEGDGSDEDSYEAQYSVVLDRPARSDFVAFVDAADDGCGTASSDAAPVDATTADYCAAFEDVFAPHRSDRLQQTGTPTGFGSDSDLSVESRHGFRAMAEVVAQLTPAQAGVLDAGDDDAMRQVVGVTDAFYADTWFLTSYQLCVGDD